MITTLITLRKAGLQKYQIHSNALISQKYYHDYDRYRRARVFKSTTTKVAETDESSPGLSTAAGKHYFSIS